MRPSEALNLHRTRIREIALSHGVSAVRVFGSALRGDDVVGSDLDLLVEPTPRTTLMDIWGNWGQILINSVRRGSDSGSNCKSKPNPLEAAAQSA